MENASKALIIAGGVLLGVALIGLALYLFASARGLVDASDSIIYANQIESFNRFYFSFDTGEKITGLDAINIINKAKNDNSSDVSVSEIALNAPAPEKIDVSNYFNKIYSYSYTLNSDGAIKAITIK